jgi:hypothetical protein
MPGASFTECEHTGINTGPRYCLARRMVGGGPVGALLAPGPDSVAARLAEWGRDHRFDGLMSCGLTRPWSASMTPRSRDLGGVSRAETSLLIAAEQHTVVAAFNGGFRLNGASHGGYIS